MNSINEAKFYQGKKVLITGAAGSIGSAIARQIISLQPEVLRLLDINETGLFDLGQEINSKNVRLLVGDIRDKDRLRRAFEDIDIIFHAAALKHVSLCETNPFEAVQTNIIGSQNVIDVALEKGVGKVIGISTDKAVNPINVMGATKLLVERLFMAASQYKGSQKTLFSCVRFGNVLCSRGSVIPVFQKQLRRGRPITVTNPAMSRFTMSINEAVSLILKAGLYSKGNDIFILKMPTMNIQDLAETILENHPDSSTNQKQIEIIGNAFAEKMHEELIAECELPFVSEADDMYVVDFSKTIPVEQRLDSTVIRQRNHLSKHELTQLLKINNII